MKRYDTWHCQCDDGEMVQYKEAMEIINKHTPIKDMVIQAHNNAIKRNFYRHVPKVDVFHKLNEEIIEFYNSEPMEGFHKDSEQSEISDIIIVLLAYCGEMGYDIEQALIDKLNYNDSREY